MRVGGVALVAGLLGAAAGLVGVVRMAGRLDRLHVRTDAAWAALDAALSRRALVVSGPGGGCPSAAGVVTLGTGAIFSGDGTLSMSASDLAGATAARWPSPDCRRRRAVK